MSPKQTARSQLLMPWLDDRTEGEIFLSLKPLQLMHEQFFPQQSIDLSDKWFAGRLLATIQQVTRDRLQQDNLVVRSQLHELHDVPKFGGWENDAAARAVGRDEQDQMELERRRLLRQAGRIKMDRLTMNQQWPAIEARGRGWKQEMLIEWKKVYGQKFLELRETFDLRSSSTAGLKSRISQHASLIINSRGKLIIARERTLEAPSTTTKLSLHAGARRPTIKQRKPLELSYLQHTVEGRQSRRLYGSRRAVPLHHLPLPRTLLLLLYLKRFHMSAITAIPQEPGGMSPSSSPRLPSPPPFPEVQTAPKSPMQDNVAHITATAKGPSRRIRPGTTAAEMAKGPPLVPLSEIDSPFQLQEYLKALHHKETHDIENNPKSLDKAGAIRLATPPEGVERSLWLYELCRLLIMRVNILIVGFFNDTPKCSVQNCPEMRASEWQYLCAVHDPPKSCCAIDYCCHTLDWAGNIITSQKHFPSRLTLGGDGGASQQGIRQLTNIFRRVYRMFAHAWFQHRQVFWKVEGEEGLYLLYKTVCDVYSLMPADTYTVPPEAEGLSAAEDAAAAPRQQAATRTILFNQTPTQELPSRPNIDREGSVINISETGGPVSTLNTATATKRHKHTPSTGSFVPTITEDEENEDRNAAKRQSSTEEDDALTTVRYDPKDFHPVAPPEDPANDNASEVTVIIDPPASTEKDFLSAAQTADKLDEETKSPVTPIDDEPSPESDGLATALQSKDEPSEAKELMGGPEVGKVSEVPAQESAVAEEESDTNVKDESA